MAVATCEKCGQRIGWLGEISERPKCPGCGYRPPQSELDDIEAQIRELTAEVIAEHSSPLDASPYSDLTDRDFLQATEGGAR